MRRTITMSALTALLVTGCAPFGQLGQRAAGVAEAGFESRVETSRAVLQAAEHYRCRGAPIGAIADEIWSRAGGFERWRQDCIASVPESPAGPMPMRGW